LQDQHFDLVALDSSAKTFDEGLAVRALVEGDARAAEMRYRLETNGSDPLVVGPSLFTTESAREESERFFSTEGIPPFLSAYASFCYSYGSVVVAKAIGLHDAPARWDTERVDALFRGGLARSSEAVLRATRGLEVDPIVEVGLTRLPAPLGEKYEMREVDRLGAWIAWILLREAGEERFEISMDWDGDQLVVIGWKDHAQPPAAVVWTTAWESEEVAKTVVADLKRMHAAAAEPLVIDRRGVEVVFAKGVLTDDEIRLLATAALYDRSSGPRPVARRTTIDLDRFFSRSR
jgi:hypothetical protein